SDSSNHFCPGITCALNAPAPLREIPKPDIHLYHQEIRSMLFRHRPSCHECPYDMGAHFSPHSIHNRCAAERHHDIPMHIGRATLSEISKVHLPASYPSQ